MKKYRYDTHVHTAETSRCGWMPGAHVADLYRECGYTGIVITDHLHEGYIDSLPCRDDWDDCVEAFLRGYRAAKKRGDEIGLEVLPGMELRFPENNNDYLVYGFDEAMLRRMPYPYRMGPEAFFRRYGDELMIIHAHPFRDGNEFVRADCVHGLEMLNGSIRHHNFDEKTLALCEKNPRLYRVCGSDAHRPGDEGLCWVGFDRKLHDSSQYKDAVEYDAYELGCVKPSPIIDACNAFLRETRG